MMGTIATSSLACAGDGVAAAGPSPAVPPMTGPSADSGAVLDPGINKPLPSGWERCLDLKSGEVFIKKKSEVLPKGGMGPSCAQVRGAQFIQRKDWKQPCVGHGRVPLQALQEQKLDWSHKWVGGRMTSPMQPPPNSSSSSRAFLNFNGSAKPCCEEEGSTSPERKPLCLDLDLSLTSMNRNRLTSEALDKASANSSIKVTTSAPAGMASLGVHQSWKWQTPPTNKNEKPASIQEMISESTMATAVCSKCLMYVLLKKSNPTCPRCLNPIILDCGPHPISPQKRARLEFPPDELSLSTDSSRLGLPMLITSTF